MGEGGGLTEPQGIVRIVSFCCVFICFVMVFTGHWNYADGYGGPERVLEIAVLMAAPISLLLIILAAVGVEHEILTAIDKVYHVVFACIFIICSIYHIEGTDRGMRHSGEAYNQRVVVGTFAWFFGCCCVVLSYMMLSGGGG